MKFRDERGIDFNVEIMPDSKYVGIISESDKSEVVSIDYLRASEALDDEAAAFKVNLMKSKMVFAKSWQEFRDTGLFWWINMILHTFGWALIVVVEENGEISNAYPARTKFRGFGQDSITEGFRKISNYMVANAEELKKEADE